MLLSSNEGVLCATNCTKLIGKFNLFSRCGSPSETKRFESLADIFPYKATHRMLLNWTPNAWYPTSPRTSIKLALPLVSSCLQRRYNVPNYLQSVYNFPRGRGEKGKRTCTIWSTKALVANETGEKCFSTNLQHFFRQFEGRTRNPVPLYWAHVSLLRNSLFKIASENVQHCFFAPDFNF